jgi:6-phosphogluconolactonase
MNVDRFPTSDDLTIAAATRFAESAEEAIAAHGAFFVALSGGSTPRAVYAMLASPLFSSRIDWESVVLFWGDERCVPPDDPQSNYRMACEALIDHVPLRAENVHRIRGEDSPAIAAEHYERDLRALFATPTGAPRDVDSARFDLVLLGLGANGHTASLFPRMRAVHERTQWVMAENIEAVRMWRVTLTPAVINAARDTIFLVTGADKAPALRRVLYGARDIDELPAQAIVPAGGTLHWMVDAAAAADLPEQPVSTA